MVTAGRSQKGIGKTVQLPGLERRSPHQNKRPCPHHLHYCREEDQGCTPWPLRWRGHPGGQPWRLPAPLRGWTSSAVARSLIQDLTGAGPGRGPQVRVCEQRRQQGCSPELPSDPFLSLGAVCAHAEPHSHRTQRWGAAATTGGANWGSTTPQCVTRGSYRASESLQEDHQHRTRRTWLQMEAGRLGPGGDGTRHEHAQGPTRTLRR